MGGIAVLAKQAGHTVSGSDENVYPPMSTQLEAQGIELCVGYKPEHITDSVDRVVIGNVMSRGNALVEYVLNNNLPYSSGPQWLAENVLSNHWVLAVAGTHGKTTTSSMLAWILDYAGLKPGFLIGGVPENFGLSARYGEYPFFVVEADEYDTAFFDKRSKFVHYSPRTLVLNNLEFDHADIFENIAAIQKQFHHLIRTIPGEGLIVCNNDEENLTQVLDQGCWTKTETFSASDNGQWSVADCTTDGTRFSICLDGKPVGEVSWNLHGKHNRMNVLAAIAAARHAGVPVGVSCEAMAKFKGIKRRLEIKGKVNGITVYDDFAHHPTAIEETLGAMQELANGGRVFAVLEPRSNTMRLGVHTADMMAALKTADEVLLYQPAGLDWDLSSAVAASDVAAKVYDEVDLIIDSLSKNAAAGDHILIMSNGGFESIHDRLLMSLSNS